ncbi:MAG TPA: DinB family protein [Actinophytocola sp.]|uniref:DinB family protein n=1 Tax=Actinophytocola sp. TaxID=1872138 RepID=UPI002DDCA788|nr:DinB family protein [Actinophytocola sp.]HEV2784085.1 DinB family protein [Actinophytocola sp.]
MITPDTKDWTWVLTRPCPECGLDTRGIRPEQVPDLLRANATAWHELLSTHPEPARRPRPDTWSPLEYACHVRDVCRIYDHRLHLMLTEDNPTYPDWNQDQTALDDDYAHQNPHRVAAELRTAADTLATHLAEVSGPAWHRPGTRDDGAHFTIATFARYFIHDPLHHLYDVTGTRMPAPEA